MGIPWIEFNGPYDDTKDLEIYGDYPPPPDLSEKAKAIFGDHDFLLLDKLFDEGDRILRSVLAGTSALYLPERCLQVLAEQNASPEVIEVWAKQQDLVFKYRKWTHKQPETWAWIILKRDLDFKARAEKAVSFCGQGLCNPGVQVALIREGDTKEDWVFFGEYDNGAHEIRAEDTILRYRVLVQPSDFKPECSENV